MTRVVVVGGGIAGTAAALAARRRGAEVVMVHAHAGASTLATGALDRAPWERALRAAAKAAAPSEDERAVLDALDLVALPEAPVLLATTAGILRPAAGRDRALLDLSRLGMGAVLVPQLEHPRWDGARLARTWAGSAVARARGLTFAPVRATILRREDERFLGDADMAARHDDGERLEWLAARLRDAIGTLPTGAVAFLLPPWLGVGEPRAEALSARVGVPCGEALGEPGGPAGLRFERARDRALEGAGVARVVALVTRVTGEGSAFAVACEGADDLRAHAVVLAAGGLVGGGLAYSPGEATLSFAMPPEARPTFQLAFEAPVQVGVDGEALTAPGSLFGVPPESLAWPFQPSPVMERVGVVTTEEGAVRGAPQGLFAAGDVRADRPRTWLAALADGARAGAAAAVVAVADQRTKAPRPASERTIP